MHMCHFFSPKSNEEQQECTYQRFVYVHLPLNTCAYLHVTSVCDGKQSIVQLSY